MLFFNLVEAAILLFSAATFAQTTNDSTPVWNVVLTTPEQTTGIIACKPSSNGYFVNGGLEVTIFDEFSPDTACYNIANLFAASGKTPLRECYPSNSTCDFQLSDHSTYNSTANYSRVGFQTGIVPGKEGSQPDTSVLTFRTFEGADCASDPNHNWHQWSCDTYIGDCSTMSYSVRSFSISATPEANKTGCYVASERAKTEAPSDGNEEGMATRPVPGTAVIALAVTIGVVVLV